MMTSFIGPPKPSCSIDTSTTVPTLAKSITQSFPINVSSVCMMSLHEIPQRHYVVRAPVYVVPYSPHCEQVPERKQVTCLKGQWLRRRWWRRWLLLWSDTPVDLDPVALPVVPCAVVSVVDGEAQGLYADPVLCRSPSHGRIDCNGAVLRYAFHFLSHNCAILYVARVQTLRDAVLGSRGMSDGVGGVNRVLCGFRGLKSPSGEFQRGDSGHGEG